MERAAAQDVRKQYVELTPLFFRNQWVRLANDNAGRKAEHPLGSGIPQPDIRFSIYGDNRKRRAFNQRPQSLVARFERFLSLFPLGNILRHAKETNDPFMLIIPYRAALDMHTARFAVLRHVVVFASGVVASKRVLHVMAY